MKEVKNRELVECPILVQASWRQVCVQMLCHSAVECPLPSDGTFPSSISTSISPIDYNVSSVGTLEVRDHSCLYLSA